MIELSRFSHLKGPLGVYIHIPFCLAKCKYCDFCSFPIPPGSVPDAYVDRLIEDIEDFGLKTGRPEADTIFFGGGTPTLLSVRQWGKIMEQLSRSFRILPGAEISTECNPSTADRALFSELKSLGFNRVSIGMQSANNDELSLLGRVHRNEQTVRTVRDAYSAGFREINLDLMFGIPGQTKDSFEHSIRTACSLPVTHISSYALQLEPGTPLEAHRNEYVFPDDDQVADMYDALCSCLSELGYERYEISNFSIPGHECRHNLKYWTGAPYMGFGISSHSFLDRTRFFQPSDLDAYLTSAAGYQTEEELTPERFCDELLVLGLRLTRGVSLSDISRRSGVDALARYGTQIDTMRKQGTVDLSEDRLTIQPQYTFISNSILDDLLPDR